MPTRSIPDLETTRITQTLSSQASITDAVTKLVRTGATPSAQFTTNGVLPPTRIRRPVLPALSSQFTITAATPLIVAFGVSTKSSSFSMSVSADRIRLGLNEVFISVATVADVNPTIIWGPTITFQSVAIILSLGLGYAIDPWRTLPIRSETRINILEQETRTYMIPSETRTLTVLPGANTRIVNEPGIIDRREG